jgi:thiamine-monophosphate kinase
MNIDIYGEFDLIGCLKKCVTAPADFVIIGISDDAAAFETEAGKVTLMTADALVEKVHFDLSFVPFRDLGWRAMAANLSDIAAMGGSPTCATVCLCAPSSCAVEDLEDLYTGMDAVAAPLGCRIVGGDTTASPSGLMISISLLGQVTKERMTPRSGVKPGDLFGVTGHLGGSRAGLEVLRRGQLGRPLPGGFEEAVKKYLNPVPRVREAEAMGDAAAIHAAIDVSDGLSSEVHHLCRMSRVGARIEGKTIPIHADTEAVARLCDAGGLAFALTGGEDFELLFTVAPHDAEAVARAVEAATGTPVTLIGEAVPPEEGVCIRLDGSWYPLDRSGYDHFKNTQSQA